MSGDRAEAQKLSENLKKLEAQLHERYQRSSDALAASYDQYMKTALPKPTFLPVRIKVIFANHMGQNLENLQVEQFEDGQTLLT